MDANTKGSGENVQQGTKEPQGSKVVPKRDIHDKYKHLFIPFPKYRRVAYQTCKSPIRQKLE